MAQYSITGQGINASLPNAGDYFTGAPGAGDDKVFRKNGDNFDWIFKNQFKGDAGSLQVINPGSEGIQYLQRAGLGKFSQANDLNAFHGAYTGTNPSYTQSVSPDNPNGINVNSSTNGTVISSPTAAQAQSNALKDPSGIGINAPTSPLGSQTQAIQPSGDIQSQLARAQAMANQTKAQGFAPFAGSSYDTASKTTPQGTGGASTNPADIASLVARSQAMANQTKAQGFAPFAGSSYDTSGQSAPPSTLPQGNQQAPSNLSGQTQSLGGTSGGTSSTGGGNLSSYEQAVADAMKPSQEQTNLQNQQIALDAKLKAFDQGAGQDQLNVEGQPIAHGFITGQQAALQKQSALNRTGITNDEQTLTQRLALAQQRQQSALDVSKFNLDRQDAATKAASDKAQQDITNNLKQQELANTQSNTQTDNALAQQKFNEDVRQYGMDYALKQKQVAIDQQNANTNAMKAGTSITTSNGTYTPGANKTVDSWANRIQNGTAKITDIPASQAGLRNQVSVALDAMGNSADGKPTTTEMGKAALVTAKGLMDKFNSNVGIFGGNTSPVGINGILGTIPGTSARNFSVDFDTLKNQLSLEGIRYLKGQGQVSDSERALLASAVTKLNRSQSPSEFKTTLQGIIDRLSGSSDSTTAGQTSGGNSYTIK